MEAIVQITGIVCIAAMASDFINDMYYKNKNAEDFFTIIIYIIAWLMGMQALGIFAGEIHILNKQQYREYKELKSQYLNSPDLFRNNNRTCWNINGAKHCGDFTYEDSKTIIEVKNGTTNVTVK